jgi:hypothetical protein
MQLQAKACGKMMAQACVYEPSQQKIQIARNDLGTATYPLGYQAYA